MTTTAEPLSDAAIEEYLKFACRLAELAGEAILPHFRSGVGVENKAKFGYDPVTLADKRAEQIIRAEIARSYPAHSILGEEYGRNSGASPLTWIVDPIDGTRGFMMGLPQWGTLLALNDEPGWCLALCISHSLGRRSWDLGKVRTCVEQERSSRCTLV